MQSAKNKWYAIPALKAILLTIPLLLAGCVTPGMMQATPQIRTSSGKEKVSVKSPVSFVAGATYSPDGRLLLSGGTSPVVSVWDINNAKELKKLKLPITAGTFGSLSGISYSPDHKTLAIGTRTGIFSGDTTMLLDADTGQKLRTIDTPMGGPLYFSPDGKYLLGMETTIHLSDAFSGKSPFVTKLIDVASGQIAQTFPGYYDAVMSPRGSRILMTSWSESPSEIVEYDYAAQREVWRRSASNTVSALAYSPDGRTFVEGSYHSELFGNFDIYVTLFDAATGSPIRQLIHYTIAGGFIPIDAQNSLVNSIAFSPDGEYFITGNNKGEYRLWETATGKQIRKFDRPNEKTSLGISSASASFSPNGKVVALASAASIRLYNVKTGAEIAALIAFDDGQWLITTPNGYYNSSEKGDEYLDVSIAGKPYTTSQLRESFYRPDLVKLALAGGSLGEFRQIADVKPPPVISIIDTPTASTQNQITVSLEIKDQGGGIGDVRLYRNGTAVLLENSRNLQVTSAAAGGNIMHFNVNLEPGDNNIRAIAFNSDNSMQSTEASIDVKADIAARPPALYAVIVGIKTFENPRLDLTYPVADAKLFASTIRNKGQGLFRSIRIRTLTTPQETTKSAIVAALQQARKEVQPEDLFVFYVASHGTVEDGRYLLITSNVGSTSTLRLKQDALSQDSLKELISNISASKKLVVLDTCDAGKMGNVLQVALLTRGMSDDTAMKILSRAVGSTVLSASSSNQEALEGYKGHGLFTYVVAQGLDGAADENHDGFVKTLELSDYVDSQVPVLAEQVFNHKQYPIVSPSGQGFPLSKVR